MKFKLVPEELTKEMEDAGIEAWKAGLGSFAGTYMVRCYKAMLAAAPQPGHDSITMTDEMAKEWDAMGLKECVQIDRIKDWSNMLEKRLAEFDPLYRAYPWGRSDGNTGR